MSKDFPFPQPLVIFGPQGVGKTSLGLEFPDPWVLHDPWELGVYTLVRYNRSPKPKHKPVKFENFPDFMDKVSNPPDGVGTLLIDGLFGFQTLAANYKTDQEYEGDFDKFMDYRKGYANLANNELVELIGLFQEEYIEKGINVVLLSQVELNKVDNPYGPDYHQFGPMLDTRMWAPFKTWADAVLFYDMQRSVRRENPKDKRNFDGKVTGTSYRCLHTEFCDHHEGKNRMGLPEAIDGNSSRELYQNYRQAVLDSFNKKGDVDGQE